jgi:uncharacterized damage-inducible protein DinB
MVRLDHVLETWKAIRQDTIAAAEEFPAPDFAFRPSPDVMTFGEIARHIAEAGRALTGMLLAGDEMFTGPDFRARITQFRYNLPDDTTPAGIVEALKDFDARAAELAAQSPEFYSKIVTRMDGVNVTRLEMLQSIKEHEMTHRQQLFMYMRLKAMVPSTTRRRMAKQAGK